MLSDKPAAKPGLFLHYFHSIPWKEVFFFIISEPFPANWQGLSGLFLHHTLWRSAGTINWEQSLAVNGLPHTWEETEALLGSSCALCCTGPWELPQALEGAHGSSIITQLSPALSEGCWSHQWVFPRDKRAEWPSKSHISRSCSWGIILSTDFIHISNYRLKTTTYLEDVRVWFMGNNQSLPMFPRLFSHRQRDILDLVAPAQTSEHSVQLPPESSQWKNHSSHLGICIPPSPSKFHLGKNLQNCRA